LKAPFNIEIVRPQKEGPPPEIRLALVFGTFRTDINLAYSDWSMVVKAFQISTICYGAYLYLVLDFFLRFPARIPGYGSLRPTLLMAFVIFVLLFLQKEKLKGKANDPIIKAMLVLIVYLCLSIFFVEWPGSVIRENAQDFIKAIIFLFFTALIIDSEKRLKVFLSVFIGCQVFRVLEPLYLNITTGYMGDETYVGGGEFAQRLAGAPADVINANELGFVIATVIPFLHFLLWYGKWYSKLTYIILLPLFLYAMMLTSSRGALIALLAAAFVIFWYSKNKLVLLVAGVVIAAVAWNNMSEFQHERYLSILGGDSVQALTAEGRIKGGMQELKLGFRRPIVGHGIGTTKEAKWHAYGGTLASHNLYAELLIEIGMIGFMIFFVFLYRIYQRFSANKQKIKQLALDQYHFYSRLNMAMIAVFSMYAVYSVNYFGLSQYYWYLFGGMAIVFGRLIDEKIAAYQPVAEKIQSKEKPETAKYSSPPMESPAQG